MARRLDAILCLLALLAVCPLHAAIVNVPPTTRVFVPDGDGLVLFSPPQSTGASPQKDWRAGMPPGSLSQVISQVCPLAAGADGIQSSARPSGAGARLVAKKGQSPRIAARKHVLRFCGIDCPEHGQRDMEHARAFVENAIRTSAWRVVVLGLDVHGRTLVTLRNVASGASLATLLVERGYCVVYPAFLSRCPPDEQAALRAAQETAFARTRALASTRTPHRRVVTRRFVARPGVEDALVRELGACRAGRCDVRGQRPRAGEEALPWAFRRRVEESSGTAFFTAVFSRAVSPGRASPR